MIKAYASIASVGFLLISGAFGCSSADTPDTGGGGTGNTGTSGTGTSGTATTAGTGTGGTSATAGTGAGGTSTTAGTGTGGTGVVVPPECKGIKTGMACSPEGTDCPSLACGLADSGSRSCMCATNWSCSACDYTNSPFKDRPADIMPCTGTEADKVSCTGMQGKVCEGAPGGEVCACWPDDEGMVIWDCDKAPTSWPAATM